jgi:hypothetical protein
MSLLPVIGRRLAAPLMKSIDQKAQMLKVRKPPDSGVICRQVRGTTTRSLEVRPGYGNVRPAAVRQFHKQSRLALALETADYGKRPPFKGMALPNDRCRSWKVLARGSLEMLPSMPLTISCCFARYLDTVMMRGCGFTSSGG